MTNEQYHEYLVARGFLKRIKEAMETGIYPDKERGEELIKTFEQKVIEFEAKQKICDTN